MGVLKVREPGGPWVPITGVGNTPPPSGITAGEADLRYVNVTGDTMTGQLRLAGPAGAEQLSFPSDNDYMGFWTGATRNAYIQGSSGGLRINADVGELTIGAANNRVQVPGLSIGASPVYGGYYGIHYQSGNYLMMQNGTDTLISANGGIVSIRGGTNGSYQLNINGNGWHDLTGHLNMMGHQVHNASAVTTTSTITSGGDLVVNGTWTTINHMTIRNACHVTSNGTTGGYYYDQGFLVQCAGGVTRSGYGMHPGGYAGSMAMNTNNGAIFFYNTDGGWYTDIWCSTVSQASSIKGKTDIASWPPKSAGSAVMDACNRLSLIDVVSYRIKPEMALVVATAEGEERRLHDCAVDDCDGTPAEPCTSVRNQQNPHIGILIEDLATVLPEAVALDDEGQPGGMRTGTMIGYLLAVCKEQQQRIEALEHQLEAA